MAPCFRRRAALCYERLDREQMMEQIPDTRRQLSALRRMDKWLLVWVVASGVGSIAVAIALVERVAGTQPMNAFLGSFFALLGVGVFLLGWRTGVPWWRRLAIAASGLAVGLATWFFGWAGAGAGIAALSVLEAVQRRVRTPLEG